MRRRKWRRGRGEGGRRIEDGYVVEVEEAGGRGGGGGGGVPTFSHHGVDESH